MIYIGDSERTTQALWQAGQRGTLRSLSREIYTDDLSAPDEEIIRKNLLAIVATLLPDWYISHSSAATRAPIDGLFFVSGSLKTRRKIELPGVTIVRSPALSHPEVNRLEAPTRVSAGLTREPRSVRYRVSSPLQTVFENLKATRHIPQKGLTEEHIRELIRDLSAADADRAEDFAVRSGLRREYQRFAELHYELRQANRVGIAIDREFKLFFFGWPVGTLAARRNGEFRFVYHRDWTIPLSGQMPIHPEGTSSYEGPTMPAFFENLLPEGWTEGVILAREGLAREELAGLLDTTKKYLSNLTLRPLGISEEELVFDTLDVRLSELAGAPGEVLRLNEKVGALPEDADLWRRLREEAAVRLSGVQPKLPVSLYREEGQPAIGVGDLRHACTHLLKLPAREFPFLVENEWATMELASRIPRLTAAAVRKVDFPRGSKLPAPALLVERYDIPTRLSLESGSGDLGLPLQEDSNSVLLQKRGEKYRGSVEGIVRGLANLGLSTLPDEQGYWEILRLVAFSWLVGNGDLHAKNFSVLRIIRPQTAGAKARLVRVEFAPAYDLVNTQLLLPGDSFALPVNGKVDNLVLRDFVRLAEVWGGEQGTVEEEIRHIVSGIDGELEPVLLASGLPEDLSEQYLSGYATRRDRILGAR